MKIDFQNAILLVLCLCVMLGVFTLSASAANQFLPIMDNPYPDGLAYGHFHQGSYDWYDLVSADVESLLVGVMRTGYINPTMYVISRYPGNAFYNTSVPHTVGGPTTTTPLEYSDGLYYANIASQPSDSRWTYNVDNIFNSLEDALAYAESTLPRSTSISYSLPAGNIAYIKLPSSIPTGADFTLSTTFPVLDLSSYSLNNQVSSVVSSIPSGVTSAPTSPTIPWTASGKLNLFGLSRHQSYTGHIPSQYGGFYLMVCNPLYYPVTPSGGGGVNPLENGYIDISIASAVDVTVFPLDSRLQFSGSGLVVDATTTGVYYTGEYDEDSDSLIWQDPDGGDTPPQMGGNTQIDSINDNIFDYLRNFAQSISEFLRGPVQAIKVVVGAISDFMSSFTQLYQWLPSPVYNLITAALMIALTIGVIKIFV